jgi:phosphoglycolate phosphatase
MPHKKYQLIIFDWEGTLGDAQQGGLIAGAQALIQYLSEQGYILAIATNKSQAGLKRSLENWGLTAFFSETRAAGQVPPKPNPQMLEEILFAVNTGPDAALMIGDSKHDIEMAKLAGVDAIGVDFYRRQAHALSKAGALEIFYEFEQIKKFLERNE